MIAKKIFQKTAYFVVKQNHKKIGIKNGAQKHVAVVLITTDIMRRIKKERDFYLKNLLLKNTVDSTRQ